MKFLLAFTFLLAAFFSASAQGNGELRGQVVDQNGAIVPNAGIVVTNNNGIEKTVNTNNGGDYAVSGLPAGTYTVRANVAGFAPYENTEVVIAAGKLEELTITISVAIEQQEVVISADTGRVSTDPENNADATVLRDADIQALPEDPEDLSAALQALAGASAGPNGGQFYIDGFTGGSLPPRESIREIRVNSNPFSSEYDRPGFGRIEIFTKPGADRYRGQVFLNFNDESLNSRNPFAVNRAASQVRFFGGNLSGPIIKNKASFFIDADNRGIDDNSVVNASILDASLNPTLFAQSFVVPRRSFEINPRLDYAINDRNTLIIRYSYERNTADLNGIGGFNLPTLATQSKGTENNIRITETAILSPTFINETRFQFERNRSNQQGNNSVPTISVAGSFNGGGSNIGLNFNNDDRYELQNYSTWTLGKHNVKFGVRLRGINLDTRSESNFAGNFTFAGIPLRFNEAGQQIDSTTGALIASPVRFVDGTLPTTSVSSLDQYRQRILGNTDQRFNPSQFTINTGDPLAGIGQTDLGLFVNDDFRIRPDLTVNYGLRYEAQTNVSRNLNFAPRFGFAYSPGAGGNKPAKTVFRGGFGIFYDRISENLSLQQVRFDGSRQVQYFVTDQNILRQAVFTANGVTNIPTVAQIAGSSSGSSTIRRLSDDLQSPYTAQTTFSVERQLPLRTTLSFTFLTSQTRNLLRTLNVNAPVCPTGFACPTVTAAFNALRPNPAQGNIYQYESTGRFNQNQFLINFNTRFSQGVSIRGNYRLNKAKSDVDGGGGFGGGGAQAGGFPFYSYDLNGEYGDSNQDIRHVFFVSANFTLPYRISLSPFVTARSGVPFNITTGVDSNRDSVFVERPTFGQLNARCQFLGLTNSYCNIGDNDANAFIPRNYGTGPSSLGVNLNVNKTFGFGSARNTATGGPAQQQPEAPAAGTGRAGQPANASGGGGGRGGNGGGQGGGGGGRGGFFGQFSGETNKPYNLTLGVQVSNLFNRTNLGNPVSNLSAARFGQFNSISGNFGGFGGGGGGGSNAGNRQVRLSLRFSF